MVYHLDSRRLNKNIFMSCNKPSNIKYNTCNYLNNDLSSLLLSSSFINCISSAMKPVEHIWKKVKLKKIKDSEDIKRQKIKFKSKNQNLIKLISKFLFLFLTFMMISTVKCSILPFNIGTNNLDINTENNLLPEKIIHFKHYIIPTSSLLSSSSSSSLSTTTTVIQGHNTNDDDGNIEQYLIDEDIQGETILLNKVDTEFVKLKCEAKIDEYFLNSSKIEDRQNPIQSVQWINNNGTLFSTTDTIVIEKPSEELQLRCIANINSIDTLNNGTILSHSIKFTNHEYSIIQIEPKILKVPLKSSIRLVCRWPISYNNKDIIWIHNNEILNKNKNVIIGTINGKSILHILSVNDDNIGEYKCIFKNDKNITSNISKIIIDNNSTEYYGIELSETSEGFIGDDVILECLLPKIKNVEWSIETNKPNFKSNNIQKIKRILGNDTLLILRNITDKMNRNYICESKFSDGKTLSMTTTFNVLNSNLFNNKNDTFIQTYKKQGMTMSFRCETYDILNETPDTVIWYKNSKIINKNPYIKIVKSYTNGGIGYSDLIIGITESNDTGIYTCIINNNNNNKERIKIFNYYVEITTNDTIKNLNIISKHDEKCLLIEFDLPDSTDISWAHFTTYFVVYYKYNNTESLNSLPTTAKCNYKGHCKIKLCSISTDLEENTEYIFRISMVLSGVGTVITPLSKPYKSITWDGLAKKSLSLNIIYDKNDNFIELKWNKPDKSEINGEISKYIVQIINYSNKLTNLLSIQSREYYEIDKNDDKFIVKNVTDTFGYKFRVIPITRSKKLPLQYMPFIEHFPFILYTSNDFNITKNFNQNITTPRLTVNQIELSPKINVKWSIPDDMKSKPKPKFKLKSKLNKIIIKYQNIFNTKSNFITVEKDIHDEEIDLTESIEPGYVYEICATFISDDEYSFWNCITTPVKTSDNSLIFLTEKDAIKSKHLPKKVDCDDEKIKCLCINTDNGLKVQWDNSTISKNNDTRDGDNQSNNNDAKINYIIHYTLNETDPKRKEFETTTNDGELYADLSMLLPNVSYRIMIESINELGDSIQGDYFTCNTSSSISLPPPTNLNYRIVNTTHVNINWIPVHTGNYSNIIDSYVLFIKKDGSANEKVIYVNDSKSYTKMIGNLYPLTTYYVTISSNSPSTGISKIKSEQLLINLPSSGNSNIDTDIIDDENSLLKPLSTMTSNDKMTKRQLYFLVAFISLFISIIFLLIVVMINLCNYSIYPRYIQWRQRREQERLARMRSNASSALSLDSSRIGITDEPILNDSGEVLPLLQLPPDPPGFEDNPYMKDTKGPVGGPRPLGNKRFLKLWQDPEFRQKIAELNADPTGLGLDACSRDKYYMELQKEEERKFKEIAAKQRAEIERRKEVLSKRKKINSIKPKFSLTNNVLETSFINGRKASKTSLDDRMNKRNNTEPRSPASLSMMELNDNNNKGLSPRSRTMTFYHKFFPSKKSFLSSFLKINELSRQTETPLLCSPISNGTHSIFNQSNDNHPPASSLPNLADSGIVYDEHNGSNSSSSHSGGGIRTGDRSGSTTLIDEMSTPPASRHIFTTGQIRDCRLKNGAFNETASLLVP